MSDSFHDVVQEAKRFKYTKEWDGLSDSDVEDIWNDVSVFIMKNLNQQKGVTIPGFGSFLFSPVSLDPGNHKLTTSLRPVFILSEKLVKIHGLRQKKYAISGGMPVVRLNLAQLSVESQHSLSRDAIETCVRGLVDAWSRCVASGRPVEFVFAGIGRLNVFDLSVKMAFCKAFMRTWDNSSDALIKSLQGRPSTADSVLCDTHPKSPYVPAQLRNGTGSPADKLSLPSIKEDLEERMEEVEVSDEGDDTNAEKAPTRQHRMELTLPRATTFCWDDVKAESPMRQQSATTTPRVEPLTPLHRSKTTLSNDIIVQRASQDTPRKLNAMDRPLTRASVSSCGHDSTGQELCYVCHQRARRNVYISLAEERRRLEEAEDKAVADYQRRRNDLESHRDQEYLLTRRRENEKTAAFNLVTGEAAAAKNHAKVVDYHPSFLFRQRALTPPAFIKQVKYNDELKQQVTAREEAVKKRKSEELFLGHLERAQLEEEVAAQRKLNLQLKAGRTETYKLALSAQMKMKAEQQQQQSAAKPDDGTLYFANDVEVRDEALREKRRRAHELFREQVALVEQRKRESIAKRLSGQRSDDEVLVRNRNETKSDNAWRQERLVAVRRSLEADWKRAADIKHERETGESRFRLEPSVEVLLDRGTRYRRCGQCQRDMANRGQTNVDSHYRIVA